MFSSWSGSGRGWPAVRGHHCTLSFFFFNKRLFFFLLLFLKILHYNLFEKMSFSCNHSLDGSFPPSPAEDGGSKRLSWGSLLQRLTELKGINHRATADHQCSRSETGECGSLFVSGGSTVFFKIGLTHAVAKKLYLWLHLLKHKGHELTKHKELKGMQGVLLISRLSQAAQDFNLYSFCFRICGRHVAVRVRQQFLLLPPGGDPGYRGCGNYNTNSE